MTAHTLHHDLPYEPTEDRPRRLAPTRWGTLGPRILADLAVHPGASCRAIATRLDVAQSVVSTTLSRLGRAGLVTRTGPRPLARWTLTPGAMP